MYIWLYMYKLYSTIYSIHIKTEEEEEDLRRRGRKVGSSLLALMLMMIALVAVAVVLALVAVAFGLALVAVALVAVALALVVVAAVVVVAADFLVIVVVLVPNSNTVGFQSLGTLNGGTCGMLERVEPVEILEPLETVEPLEPTEPVEPFNPWNLWKTTSGFAECTPAHQATMVLLNVPLRINYHPFILFLSLCPRSSFHLVSLQLFSLHLVSLYLGSYRFVALRIVPHYPFTLFPQSLSPILLWPNILSHYHHFILSPIIPSSCLSSLCISSFCVPSYFLPSSLHPQLQKALGLNLWKQVQRLSSPSFCLPSCLDLVFWIFLPSSCFPSSCLPSYGPPIIPSCCLAASCFLFKVSHPCVSHHYLSYPFIVYLSYLPSPLHLVSVHVASHCFVSRYLFILSLIIPSSCPVILSLPMFYDHVLSVVKSFLAFFCCWVAKLGYIIVLLRVLVLMHPSYWKSHIPQQGTREDSNPKGGGTPVWGKNTYY